MSEVDITSTIVYVIEVLKRGDMKIPSSFLWKIWIRHFFVFNGGIKVKKLLIKLSKKVTYKNAGKAIRP